MTAADASDSIVVSLRYRLDDDRFLVRVPTEHGDALMAAFRGVGLHPSVYLQESADALQYVLMFIGAAGSIADIALAVREFSRDSVMTTIKVTSGNLELEAAGYDADGIVRILTVLKDEPALPRPSSTRVDP